MPRHVRRQTYIYTITFTVLNTLGLVYVKSYGTSKIAERVDSTYLRAWHLVENKEVPDIGVPPVRISTQITAP